MDIKKEFGFFKTLTSRGKEKAASLAQAQEKEKQKQKADMVAAMTTVNPSLNPPRMTSVLRR